MIFCGIQPKPQKLSNEKLLETNPRNLSDVTYLERTECPNKTRQSEPKKRPQFLPRKSTLDERRCPVAAILNQLLQHPESLAS